MVRYKRAFHTRSSLITSTVLDDGHDDGGGARVLLELHGDSTGGFLLKNLYCLECIYCGIHRDLYLLLWEEPHESLDGCIQRFRTHKPMFMFAWSIIVDL